MKAAWKWACLCLIAVVLAMGVYAAEGDLEGDGNPESSDQATAGSGDEVPPAVPESFTKDGKLDLDAVVDHFENLYRSDSSISEAELIVSKPRRTKSMQMKMWTKGEEKALIIIQSPAREKGIATLKVDKNLWNYFPRIRRTIRIPPSMMLAPWMGSDFTNDDLVRESSFREDYTYELGGRSEDPPGWLVTFTARPGTVGLWNRFELVVSDDGLLPVQARYYDRKDRLARTLYWDEVKEFDGRLIPAHMTLIPEDEEEGQDAQEAPPQDGEEVAPEEKTELRYLDIDFDVEVPESTFSLSELEQKR